MRVQAILSQIRCWDLLNQRRARRAGRLESEEPSEGGLERERGVLE